MGRKTSETGNIIFADFAKSLQVHESIPDLFSPNYRHTGEYWVKTGKLKEEMRLYQKCPTCHSGIPDRVGELWRNLLIIDNQLFNPHKFSPLWSK